MIKTKTSIDDIYSLVSKLDSLDQLYVIKNLLSKFIETDKKKHCMDQEFSYHMEDLEEALEKIEYIYDFDPAPQNLWDHSGGEPPITMSEIYNQAYKEKYGV